MLDTQLYLSGRINCALSPLRTWSTTASATVSAFSMNPSMGFLRSNSSTGGVRTHVGCTTLWTSVSSNSGKREARPAGTHVVRTFFAPYTCLSSCASPS